MEVDDRTFIVNSPVSLAAFPAWVARKFAEHKYLTFSFRIGKDRSLDQNALLHVWLTEYAAYLLKKGKKQVTEAELEGMKRIAKKQYYSETGAQWMVFRPLNPRTGEEGQLQFRSSANYKTGEMFLFLTWLQMKAADDGCVLESRGQFNKLQQQQMEDAA